MFLYSFGEKKKQFAIIPWLVHFKLGNKTLAVSLLQICTITVTEHISDNDQFQILDSI